MKIQVTNLKEQNVAQLRRFTFGGNLENVMPLIVMDHAENKFDTHITKASNYFLYGLKNDSYKATIKKMILPLIRNGSMKSSLEEVLKTDDEDFMVTFNIGFKREIKNPRHDNEIFVLYNNLRFGITLPYLGTSKKPKDESLESWTERCIEANPELEPLRKMVSVSNNPYFIVLAFTGGFKSKERFKWPYGAGVDALIEEDVTNDPSLPEVDVRDFYTLLKYQKNAI